MRKNVGFLIWLLRQLPDDRAELSYPGSIVDNPGTDKTVTQFGLPSVRGYVANTVGGGRGGKEAKSECNMFHIGVRSESIGYCEDGSKGEERFHFAFEGALACDKSGPFRVAQLAAFSPKRANLSDMPDSFASHSGFAVWPSIFAK